jgi:uncharacterized protein
MNISPHEIAFDIDGVFADTFRLFLERARQLFGLALDYEDITEYEFWTRTELPQEQIRQLVDAILMQPLEIGIRPIPGAVEVLSRLAEYGPLFFVTARNDNDSISRWIQKQLPGVDGDSIRIIATGASQEKIPVLQENQVRYFVEDRLDTCFLLEETTITPIVFDQPWNRQPHPFQVVNGWKDLADLIIWGNGST